VTISVLPSDTGVGDGGSAVIVGGVNVDVGFGTQADRIRTVTIVKEKILCMLHSPFNQSTSG
jgi:hypothetical protein